MMMLVLGSYWSIITRSRASRPARCHTGRDTSRRGLLRVFRSWASHKLDFYIQLQTRYIQKYSENKFKPV